MVSGTKFKKNPRTWSILHYIPKTGERKEKSPKSRSWPEERSSRVRHLWGYIRPQESVFTFEVILLQHSTPPWHICSIGSRLAFLVPIMDVVAPSLWLWVGETLCWQSCVPSIALYDRKCLCILQKLRQDLWCGFEGDLALSTACTKSPPLPLLEFNSSPVNCFHGFQIKIRQQRSRGTACNRRK